MIFVTFVNSLNFILQNLRSILGCTKDTSAEAMRYILDLPPMEDRHKLAQVKAYTRVAADVSNPLHPKIGRDTKTRLKKSRRVAHPSISNN